MRQPCLDIESSFVPAPAPRTVASTRREQRRAGMRDAIHYGARLAGVALGCMVAVSATHAQDAALGRQLAFTCTSCHGTDGVSLGGMPTLAGRDRAYLAQQMRDFRDGKRQATVMHQLSKGFTDPEIDALAAHFAAIKSAPSR